MALKKIAAFVALSAVAIPVLAQDSTNTVSFNNISFSYDESLGATLSIHQFPADDPATAYPGGPTPAHTSFNWGETNDLLSGGAVYVFNSAEFMEYPNYTTQATQLNDLLATRPDFTEYLANVPDGEGLPFLPTVPASQVIAAQASYLDVGTISGIRYLTVYAQDVSPFSDISVRYTFQGVTAEGAYVSVYFPLTTTLYPASQPADFDYDAFVATVDAYYAEQVNTLNTASADSFTPSLTVLDALVQSIQVGPVTTTPEVPIVEATEEPTAGNAGILSGTWTLVSYGDPAAPTTAVANNPATITFESTGVSGTSGCNSFGGNFAFSANVVSFGEGLASTLMACDEALMAQEAAVLNVLQGDVPFAVDGSSLVFTGADGTVLTYVANTASGVTFDPGVLGGTVWTLTAYGDPASPVAPVAGVTSTLSFESTGVSGTSGCNSFIGSFSVNGNVITFGDLIATLAACEEAVMAQETALLELLHGDVSFTVENGALTLTNADGQTASYTSPSATGTGITPPAVVDAGALGGTWSLVSYGDPANPTQAAPETASILVFDTTGVSGNSGCNSFSGNFTFSVDTVTFSPLISTMMACVDDIMAQENAIFSILQGDVQFRVANGTLTLTTADGNVLNYTAATS